MSSANHNAPFHTSTGADIVTMVTVAGTALLVPLVLAALNIPISWGLYEYNVSNFPLD